MLMRLGSEDTRRHAKWVETAKSRFCDANRLASPDHYKRQRSKTTSGSTPHGESLVWSHSLKYEAFTSHQKVHVPLSFGTIAWSQAWSRSSTSSLCSLSLSSRLLILGELSCWSFSSSFLVFSAACLWMLHLYQSCSYLHFHICTSLNFSADCGPVFSIRIGTAEGYSSCTHRMPAITTLEECIAWVCSNCGLFLIFFILSSHRFFRTPSSSFFENDGLVCCDRAAPNTSAFDCEPLQLQ
jgi:hypothetical protein